MSLNHSGADSENLYNILNYGVAPDSEEMVTDSEFLREGEHDFEIYGEGDLDDYTEEDIPGDLR